MKKSMICLSFVFLTGLLNAGNYQVKEVKEVVKDGANGKNSVIVRWDVLPSEVRIKPKFSTGYLAITNCKDGRFYRLSVKGNARSVGEYVKDQENVQINVLVDFMDFIKKEYNQFTDKKYLKYATLGGTLKEVNKFSEAFSQKPANFVEDRPMMVVETDTERGDSLSLYNSSNKAQFAYVLMQMPGDTLFLPLSGKECALPVPPKNINHSITFYFPREGTVISLKFFLLWSDYFLDEKDLNSLLADRFPFKDFFW
jgi:hypothetical protein